jgi:hypothetical protein
VVKYGPLTAILLTLYFQIDERSCREFRLATMNSRMRERMLDAIQI